MPLTPEEVQKLLAKPQRTRQPSGKGGKLPSGKRIDVNAPIYRTYQTWFQLAHHLFDHDTGERMKCQNPNCEDKRNREGTITVDVSGTYMCRICFLGGWLVIDENQESLDI